MEASSELPDWNKGVVKETVADEKQIAQWIAAKPQPDQEQATREHFQELLESASQPRHASGNACIRLCYFLEQCRKSTSAIQRKVAFSRKTGLDLFNFYVEWNEKNQHRSMRQVLELLVSLITLNPENDVSSIVKMEILERILAIITHQSCQPLVKPAFKVLEFFLGKDAISVIDLTEVYGGSAFTEIRTYFQRHIQKADDPNLWHSFVYAVFEWMSLPDTSPAAGKLLVTLFQKLRAKSVENTSSDDEMYTILWQQWIRNGLMRQPGSLENIKNYLFPPLFKLDRIGSLKFLQDLSRESHVRDLESQELDAQAFLLLSAMEVGKKSGLVDEPGVLLNKGATKAHKSIILPEHSIGGLLSHKAGNVRSAAFSVLVSSISSIRPFSLKTFNLLRQNLELLHSDTDAKVRNEVLSNSKHMIGRINGAVSFLTREIALSHFKHSQISQKNGEHLDFTNTVSPERSVLQEHLDFLLWYRNFLVNELIPTASYQRHITALRAIRIVVDSGIFIPHNTSLHHPVGSQSQESRLENIFTEKMMRLLLDLLVNPFEDVRAAAAHLLELAPELCFTQQRDAESSIHPKSQALSSLSENMSNHCNGKTWDITPTETSDRERYQQAKLPELLVSFVQKAEVASRRTGRADLADGVARTHELIYCLQTTDEARLDILKNLVSELEMKVVIAEKDLAQAVLQAPIHGQFAALRLVWELFSQSRDGTKQTISLTSIPEESSLNRSKENSMWIDLQYRMIGCCTRIWASVKGVLCNDSPEGHLPQDLDDVDALDTKDILSYSFRAIHESSNLLRVMVNKLRSKFADDSPLVPFEVFHAAGNLSFEQLSRLRHRGAFSTVSLTFARCCQLSQEESSIAHPGASLLQQWYQGALMCIYEQSSTTRRSAGIPALMTGILSANSNSPALEDVMAQLKTLARQAAALTAKNQTNLPQVHAMNCLKEIFKSSSLGKRCENHIADCLQIAAENLKSKIWAIRNCGLLLLRSLIDCLFGTSESKSVTEAGWDGKSIRLAYERYPALPELLLNLLVAIPKEHLSHMPPEISAVESVFPALDIIRRAGPPKKLRAEIHACIKIHLGSSIWHVRDIAARTICTLLLDEKWLEGLTDLFETCGNSTNQIHGVLLATKYLLERRLELHSLTASEGLTILASKLDEFYTAKSHSRLNPMNEAAYVEVSVIMLKIAHLTGISPIATRLEYIIKRDTLLSQARNISPEDRESERSIPPTLTKNCCALLKRAKAIRALYIAAITGHMDQLHELVTSAIRYDIDVACDALEHMSVVWDVGESDEQDLAKLLDIYIGAHSATSSSSIRTIALRNLADILEHFFQSDWLQRTNIKSSKFPNFELSLLSKGNPDLTNAEIRITGSLLALDFLHYTQQDSFVEIGVQIQAWSDILSGNSKSENDFDTRYAAVAALRAFYSAFSMKITQPSQISFLLPSLLALYDTLNDDDDEIREAGAVVVSQILGSHQAPLAASAKLLHWLHQQFGQTEAFRTAVMQRVTNSNSESTENLEPADQQLASAMLDDDSLFAEEEQNLYIDEVREAVRWSALLATAESPLSDEISQLSSWALGGLRTLVQLAGTEDGPCGWSSKPRVFVICMKIIFVTKAIIAHYRRIPRLGLTDDSGHSGKTHGKPLLDTVHCLLEVGRRTNLHPVLLDELANSDVYLM